VLAGCDDDGAMAGNPNAADETTLTEAKASSDGGCSLRTTGTASSPWVASCATRCRDSVFERPVENCTKARLGSAIVSLTVGGSGAKMPFSGAAVTEEEIAAVRAWIEGGASP
jgi:hypothetical protein